MRKTALSLTAAAFLSALAPATACNTPEQLAQDLGPGGSQSHGGLGGLDRTLAGSAPLTLLPQDKGNESPACLDGSPYGFYFTKSASGSTKWTISIEGGGWWCARLPACLLASLSLSLSLGLSPSPRCLCLRLPAFPPALSDSRPLFLSAP